MPGVGMSNTAQLDPGQSTPHSANQSPGHARTARGYAGDELDEDGEDELEYEDDPALLAIVQELQALDVVGDPQEESVASRPTPLLSSFDLKGIANLIREGRAKRIVCMCGAGISVSAGIPDFRTPGTGLYSQLAKYQLPRPEAVFSLDFFRQNPKPFHQLAKELLPGQYRPTPTHFFLALLHKKGLLLRCFTQNIDSLETLSGLPANKVVAAHGNFDSAACIDCQHPHDPEQVKDRILANTISRCHSCKGLVKPGIVFFGEQLPERFNQLRKRDLPECDLLMVLGTSLVVFPFAGLLYDVGPEVPRLLLNREIVGAARRNESPSGQRTSAGFAFHEDDNTRDAMYLGDCDAGVRALAAELGWLEELEDLIAEDAGPTIVPQ